LRSLKKLLLILMAGVMAMLMTGCDEEYKKEVTGAAIKAYADVRPEVFEAIVSYSSGDINKTQMISIGRKFGASYVVERYLGDSYE